jgi:hypothetical protein
MNDTSGSNLDPVVCSIALPLAQIPLANSVSIPDSLAVVSHIFGLSVQGF